MPKVDVARLAQVIGAYPESVALDAFTARAWAAGQGYLRTSADLDGWLMSRRHWYMEPERVEPYRQALLTGRLSRTAVAQIGEPNRAPPPIETTVLRATAGDSLRFEMIRLRAFPGWEIVLVNGRPDGYLERWLGRSFGVDVASALRHVILGLGSRDSVARGPGRDWIATLDPHSVDWLASRDGPDLLFYWRFYRLHTGEQDIAGPIRLTPAMQAEWLDALARLVPFRMDFESRGTARGTAALTSMNAWIAHADQGAVASSSAPVEAVLGLRAAVASITKGDRVVVTYWTDRQTGRRFDWHLSRHANSVRIEIIESLWHTATVDRVTGRQACKSSFCNRSDEPNLSFSTECSLAELQHEVSRNPMQW